jgi:phenylacetic acid degradation protein
MAKAYTSGARIRCMPQVYAIDGLVPVVHPSAFVHESAVLIGDVLVGARAYVGPAACLRGDFGRIVVEEGANIQDACMLHGFPGKDTVVGAEATIGHGAALHGCVIRRGALVGINAVVNDNAEVGEDAMVAALAFVRAEARIPARALAAGIPARVHRELNAEELQWKRDNMLLYQKLAERSRSTMRRVEARTTPEHGRRRIEIPGAVPLSELKAKGKA